MDIGQCMGRGDDNKNHDPPKDLIFHVPCSSAIYTILHRVLVQMRLYA